MSYIHLQILSHNTCMHTYVYSFIDDDVDDAVSLP